MKTAISAVHARQILDSRGHPTVEAEVVLSDGSYGIASVPSGASLGKREAVEKRDGDKSKFRGLGVLKAVENVNQIIGKKIIGLDAHDQEHVDQTLIDLDGTANKDNLGANAILSVSLAIARACAQSNKEPLFQYLTSLAPNVSQRIGLEFVLPVPHFNVINGGKHADNNLSFQEFMLIPFNFEKFSDSLCAGDEIYMALKDVIHNKNFHTNVGDEGGFAPSISKTREALDMIIEAISLAGYKVGEQIYIGLDVAASTFQTGEGKYGVDGEILAPEDLNLYFKKLVDDYPFLKSIEDPFGQDDWSGFKKIKESIGKTVQIVADDLTVTNPKIFTKAILEQVANAVIVKYNQIGTLSETLRVIKMAKDSGWRTILGNRSGETCDDFEADLAVAFHLGQAKYGALARGERVVKYNRLLQIEDILGSQAKFAGKDIFNF
ncbi:phosphopyruvate hydratase [Candidatus Microgenomates bacterium]|nr:phosphopyruvate hydratase [Candidatus Microgenomates bacterium]